MAKKKGFTIDEKYFIVPECTQFPTCGGCSFQNTPYEVELEAKKNHVLSIMETADFPDFNPSEVFEGIIGSPSKSNYRNKMEFTFGDEEKGGKLQLGMRKKNSYYEVSDGSKCLICDNDFRIIVKEIKDYFSNETREVFYHKTKRTGTLRNVVIRKAFYTGEILINIVTTSLLEAPLAPLAERLKTISFSGVLKGILHTVNDTIADAVKVDSIHILYGEQYINEKLLNLSFKISPFSFFQTNSEGAKLLYETVREFAGDVYGKIIFDLYCGTGTIAQILSHSAKKVFGIELVDEAVVAAKQNAKQNGLANCCFSAGDVLKLIDERNETPDLIVLDPPREGVHPKALEKIIQFSPNEFIYVSCKPESFVKNAEIFLINGYKVRRILCHDMFPRTNHVECVVLMSRNDG